MLLCVCVCFLWGTDSSLNGGVFVIKKQQFLCMFLVVVSTISEKQVSLEPAVLAASAVAYWCSMDELRFCSPPVCLSVCVFGFLGTPKVFAGDR